jgi:hypothetical protein
VDKLLECYVARTLAVKITYELINAFILDFGAFGGDDVFDFYIRREVLFTLMVPVLWVSNISKFSLIEIIYSSLSPGLKNGLTSNFALDAVLFIKIY